MLLAIIKRFGFLILLLPAFFTKAQVNTSVDSSNNNTTLIKVEKKDSTEKLEDIVSYDSEDQVHERKTKKSYLIRKAKVLYQDMEIDADYIEIDWNTGDVWAEGKRDTAGLVIEPTIFKQGGSSYEQDAFKVNFKTKIGIAYNVRMEQQEGVMFGERVKRVNDSVMYIRGVKYTTDKYVLNRQTLDADYHIKTETGKFINGKDSKLLITGPTQIYIYDVPTPLWMPFGFIPLGDKRSAGILIPSFGEREDVGFYLQGMGIYLPFGEYLDLKLTGEVYTKGSWGTHLESTYKVNYKYSGKVHFDYENRIRGIKGITSGTNTYNKNTLYRIQWSHAQDSKANPSFVFNSSVDFTSSQYYRNSVNNTNILNGNAYNNTANSSISLTKTFDGTPFTASLTASHSQNYNSSSTTTAPINLVLPQLTVTMSRIYPFAPKSGTKKGLLQNTAMSYSFNLQNSITTNEDDLFTSEMWKNQSKNGVKHNLDLSTGVTLANYFPVTFSANYNDVWVLKTISKEYDAVEEEVVSTEKNGFDSYKTFSFSSSIQTSLYGQVNFKKEAKIMAIRHVLSPSVSFSYRPDFGSEEWGYYNTYRGADGKKVTYSKFENGVYGSPTSGLNASVSFALNNNLEMKIRDDKDSTGFKKLKIFDYFNVATAYNMAADSFKWSNITMRGSTSFFDNKLKVNYFATIDPYKTALNEDTNLIERIDKLGAFRLNNFGINFGYNFDNESFGGQKFDNKKYKKQGSIRNEEFYFDEYDYAHFSMPWKVSVQFTQSLTKTLNAGNSETTTLALTGSISPSPYWAISGVTTYDVVNQELTGTRLTFARDLRSFNFTFSWVPFGVYKTWDFYIGIKASILSDAVKYDQRSTSSLQNANF